MRAAVPSIDKFPRRKLLIRNRQSVYYINYLLLALFISKALKRSFKPSDVGNLFIAKPTLLYI